MGEIIGGLAFIWAMSAIIACFGWGMWFDEHYDWGTSSDKPEWAKDIELRHVVALAALTAPVAVLVGAGIILFLMARYSGQTISAAIRPIATLFVDSIEKRIS